MSFFSDFRITLEAKIIRRDVWADVILIRILFVKATFLDYYNF